MATQHIPRIELFDEKLTQVLGAAKGERVPIRRGYRHGGKAREVTTGLETVRMTMPRGRFFTPDGHEQEWASHLPPRYQRWAQAVGSSILGTHLGGANRRWCQRSCNISCLWSLTTPYPPIREGGERMGERIGTSPLLIRQ